MSKPPSLAAAKSHAIDTGAFLKHHRQIAEAKREHEDAGAELARAKKAAKSGSVDLDAYALLTKVRKMDEEAQIVVMRHFFEYATMLEMPIGTQFSLMDAPKMPAPPKTRDVAKAQRENALFEAGEAGLKAGRDGDPASVNPFEPGSETFVGWNMGHREGLGERATAAGMKSTENERPADVATATKKAAQGRGRPSAKAQGPQGLSGALHLNGGPPA